MNDFIASLMPTVARAKYAPRRRRIGMPMSAAMSAAGIALAIAASRKWTLNICMSQKAM